MASLELGYLNLVLQVQKKRALCCPRAACSEAGVVFLGHWNTGAGRTIGRVWKWELRLETAGVTPAVERRCSVAAGAQ